MPTFELRQDDDVLDTWFSSALVPMLVSSGDKGKGVRCVHFRCTKFACVGNVVSFRNSLSASAKAVLSFRWKESGVD